MGNVYPRDSAYDQVRRDQAREGSRMASDESSGKIRKFDKSARKKTATGHEAFLKALEESGKTQGTQIKLLKLDGEVVTGTVRCSDHFTITVRVNYDGNTTLPAGEFIDRVIFKHDISEFRALQGKKRDAAE